MLFQHLNIQKLVKVSYKNRFYLCPPQLEVKQLRAFFLVQLLALCKMSWPDTGECR